MHETWSLRQSVGFAAIIAAIAVSSLIG